MSLLFEDSTTVLLTTTATTTGLLPDDFGELVVEPALALSVFAQVATTVTTGSSHCRIPIVTADPSTAWTSEVAEIAPSDPTTQELVVTPARLAAMTIISRELADDSDPAASDVVGDGLARAVATSWTKPGSPLPQLRVWHRSPGTAPTSTRPRSPTWTLPPRRSVSRGRRRHGDRVRHQPGNSARTREDQASQRLHQPVLGVDVAAPTSRSVLGVPLCVSPHVAANALWAIDRSAVWLVVRGDASVEADHSVFFDSDQVAVKATMRVGFGFVHPASVVKVTLV